jgi:type I site-specific restriction endonuclease
VDLNRFERDPEDYKWLVEALDNLESDAGKALKLVVKISGSLSDDEMVEALESLQYLVEDLDVAKAVSKYGGITVVVNLLSHANPQVRMWSAWIVATLSQNNHAIFTRPLLEQIIRTVLELVAKEEDAEAHSKQLYVLSSMISDDQHLVKYFVDNGGVAVVVPAILHKSVGNKTKAVWLLAKVMGLSEDAKKAAEETEFFHNVQQLLVDQELPDDLRSKGELALAKYLTNQPEANNNNTADNNAAPTPVLLLGGPTFSLKKRHEPI